MDAMPLTEQRIIDHLREALQHQGELGPDTPLFSSGALDSVSMMALIAFVEEAAGIEVRAHDVTLDNFDTSARIARFAASQS